MALVETRLKYFMPPVDGSKPFTWSYSNYPGGGPRHNWTPADIDVKIENVRGREQSSEFSLKLTGFEFHKSPSVVKDFGNEALIKSTYYEECIQHLKSITGASRVVIHDHQIRGPHPGTEEPPEIRGPSRQVHVDLTAAIAERRLHRYFPESDVPKRYQIINLWRPIHNPAWRFPLALCDFRSVTNGEGGDFFPLTLRFPVRDGEMYLVTYNSQHKWQYLAGMTPDEFILIKCFDSKLDGSVAAFAPHAAFEDPNTPTDAPDRHSIEVRALVLYE